MINVNDDLGLSSKFGNVILVNRGDVKSVYLEELAKTRCYREYVFGIMTKIHNIIFNKKTLNILLLKFESTPIVISI